jgi:hypothetical protein
MKLFRHPIRPGSGRGQANRHTGLSLLEFLGCLIAVVGGAWLGAIYLGINMQHVAYTALEEADLLESVPDKWRPDPPNGDRPRSMSREQLVATLKEELTALRHEISSLRTSGTVAANSPQANNTAGGEAPGSAATSGPSKEKTLAYWTRLSDIALGEAALQLETESAFNEENSEKVLAIKGRVSRFAAKAVAVIPQDQVDPAVVQLGRQLADWYEQGGDLYDSALQIHDFPADSASRSRLVQQWKRQEVQHRNEAKLLSNRAIAVRDETRRRFGVELPPFGQPTDGSTIETDSPSAEQADSSPAES